VTSERWSVAAFKVSDLVVSLHLKHCKESSCERGGFSLARTCRTVSPPQHATPVHFEDEDDGRVLRELKRCLQTALSAVEKRCEEIPPKKPKK